MCRIRGSIEKDKATFCLAFLGWCFPGSPTIKLEEKFLVVDSGISVQKSARSLSSQHNESVVLKEKMCTSDLDLFVTVIHLTRHFSHALLHTIRCPYSQHGPIRATQRVCVRASFHLHVIHDVCLSVRCLSLRVCPSLVSLRGLLLLLLVLLVLCPALHLQCHQRRGK